MSDFEDAGIEIIARRFRRFFKKQSREETLKIFGIKTLKWRKGRRQLFLLNAKSWVK